MAGENPTAPAAPAQTATAQPQGQQPTPQHHSTRQPRDEGQRFAGPPGESSPAGGEPPAVPSSRLKRTFKENGQDVTVELTEDELWGEYQRAKAIQYKERAATQTFQRASELVKKAQTAEQVAAALASGDAGRIRAYFEQQKKDPVEALSGVLEAILAEDEMTPEQKELAAAKAQLAAMEEEKRRGQEETEVHAFQERMDRIRPELHKVWGHCLEQEGLPKTERMMETAAGVFLAALEAGHRLAPEQVAELTRQELVEAHRPLVESMEPAHLFKHYPAAIQRLDEDLAPEDFEKNFPNLSKRYWAFLAAKVRGPARRGSQAPAHRPAATPPKEGGGVMDPYFVGKLRARDS